MKLLILLLVFFPVCSFSQEDTSLRKYSYLIAGNATDSNGHRVIADGTGFFIRVDSALLFITAAHVINGCYSYSDTSMLYPENMHIFIHDLNGKTLQKLSIDIKSLRSPQPCLPLKKNPDIAIISIEDSLLNFPVYIVTDFIAKVKVNSDAMIYGYAGKRFMTESLNNALPKAIVINGYESSIFFNYRPGDKIHYDIQTPNLAEPGYSGSPVFVYHEKKWKLAGVTVAVTEKEKITKQRIIVTKQKYLFSEPRLVLNQEAEQ